MIFFKISNFQIQNHSTLHICNLLNCLGGKIYYFEKEIAKLGQVKIRRNKYSGRFQALKSKFRPKDLSLIFFFLKIMKLQQVKLYQKVFVAKLTIRHSHTPFFGAREGAKLDILN